ncbi:MAG: 5-formyltetrahydrofolate cyclo-ligase [Proteobacteria bacterium]|jgi:5,10-methenyltetrahydrofolate synthetase|nr:5-formyltetrahydrofolate cyclo-ligase [Pseudomonadota bacterium]
MKASLREKIKLRLQRWAQVSQEDQQLCNHLAEALKDCRGQTWGAYQALADEPQLRSLFVLRPEIKWVFPRVISKTEMIFETPSGLQISPSEIHGLLIPGLAFDLSGVRLGRGGGFYDRFLGQYLGKKWGICYSVCLEHELPADPWDQKVHCVWTEQGRVRVQPSP